MNILKKMLLAFLSIIFLSIAGFIYVGFEMSNVKTQAENVQKVDFTQYQILSNLETSLSKQISELRAYCWTGTEQSLNNAIKYREENYKLIEAVRAAATTPEARSTVDNIKKEFDLYNDIIFKKIIPLQKAGQVAEVIRIAGTEGTPVVMRLEKILSEAIANRTNIFGQVIGSISTSITSVGLVQQVISVFVLILGVSIGTYVARDISKAVAIVAENIQKAAAGDLTVQTNIKRSDEIGLMANAFDKMMIEFRKVIADINRSAEQLASASEEMTASSEQSANVATQIAQSITEVAESSSIQLDAVDKTSIALEKMNKTVEILNTNVRNVTQATINVAEHATTGVEDVNKAFAQMGNIEKQWVT